MMKCYINIDWLSHNPSGTRKKWTTDGVPTYVCSLYPSYHIWEKNTKYNGYNGYSGYVNCRDVELIQEASA